MKIVQCSLVVLTTLLASTDTFGTPCSETLQTFTQQLSAQSAKDLYPNSIALLATAQCDTPKQYQTIRTAFIKLFPPELIEGKLHSDQISNFNLWMLGRLVYADSIQKYPEQNTLAKILQNGLNGPHIDQSAGVDLDDDSSMYMWAYAYAIAANPELYAQNMILNSQDLKMKTNILFQNPNLSDSNKGWIITMDILAAANANDHAFYELLKKFILIKKVVDPILLSDYRTWAWGIVRQAAAKMQDTELFNIATQAYQLNMAALQKTPVADPKVQQMALLISGNTFDYTPPMPIVGVKARPAPAQAGDSPALQPK